MSQGGKKKNGRFKFPICESGDKRVSPPEAFV
uniref:Uncharacterized protein n=1 Tax=Anguilla anguilla TaxID=7936 RepID=A0A0E9R691_ANGAN